MSFNEKDGWNYLLLLLGRQAYTEEQLSKKLKKKGLDEVVIKKLLTKLHDLNLIDDGLYAKQYIANRQSKKGPLALKWELSQKGISEKVIEENLSKLDDENQARAINTILEKNLWRFKGDSFKRRQKAYVFLSRRGFSSEIISEIVKEFFTED